MRVGYIGLGAMGGALARHLVGKHSLTVFDLNKSIVNDFCAQGAKSASTCAELASDCEVVILCLPRSSDVKQVLFGPEGLAQGLSAGAVLIDQTSGVPGETYEFAQQLLKIGVSMLDAPVSGAITTASAGTIAIIASGPSEVFKKVEALLRDISPNVFYCGARVGNGQTMKSVNNLMNVGCRLATLETVALGRKLGLSLESLTEALNHTAGRTYTSQGMLPNIAAGRQSTKFHLALQVKDMNQAIMLGTVKGVPMPIAGVGRGLLQIGLNTLGPQSQLEEIIGLVERMAGTSFVASKDAPKDKEVS